MRKLTRFHIDITSTSAWQSVYDYVDKFGKFDLAICSHVLEDVLDPRVVAEALPRIAKAGFVRVPSKYHEFERGREEMSYLGVGPYLGSIHHRYIYTIQHGQMIGVPKLPFLEFDPFYDTVGSLASNRSLVELSFWWNACLPFTLLNDGYIGPSVEAVIGMWRERLGADVVDDVTEALSTIPAAPQLGQVKQEWEEREAILQVKDVKQAYPAISRHIPHISPEGISADVSQPVFATRDDFLAHVERKEHASRRSPNPKRS